MIWLRGQTLVFLVMWTFHVHKKNLQTTQSPFKKTKFMSVDLLPSLSSKYKRSELLITSNKFPRKIFSSSLIFRATSFSNEMHHNFFFTVSVWIWHSNCWRQQWMTLHYAKLFTQAELRLVAHLDILFLRENSHRRSECKAMWLELFKHTILLKSVR